MSGHHDASSEAFMSFLLYGYDCPCCVVRVRTTALRPSSMYFVTHVLCLLSSSLCFQSSISPCAKTFYALATDIALDFLLARMNDCGEKITDITKSLWLRVFFFLFFLLLDGWGGRWCAGHAYAIASCVLCNVCLVLMDG